MTLPIWNAASDETLLESAAKGSQRAFEALMDRYMRVVYSYIALRASSADAADILQETMLAVWQGISGFDRRSSLKTWLLAVARRKLCDFYRARQSARELSMSEAFPDSCGEEFDIDSGEDMAAGITERLDAAAAIKSLDAGERDLIYLIFEAGLTYAEVSEATGIPVGTIKSRMSALRAKLRGLLGEDYNEL